MAVAPLATRLSGDQEKQLIVTCQRPCRSIVGIVNAAGGRVTREFDNIDAVAVTIPSGRMQDLIQAAGPAAVRKDHRVAQPRPVKVTASLDRPLNVVGLSSASTVSPLNYDYNNALTGAAALHAQGTVGEGVVVAVIDSGIANAPTISALAGSIIGGESLVPAAVDSLSSTHRENGWHGTAVATMIAAHGAFVFANASTIVRSLNAHAPGSTVPCPGPPFLAPCAADSSLVPMTGTAPRARLYALKVFPAVGDDVPESRIMAAMDRTITLRRNFMRGMPSVAVAGDGSEQNPFVYDSLDIRVVNMSLGGMTLFAGRDLQDQLTLKMLEAGITLVTAAGNSGFGAMTGGSPGTGFGSLTVGAASTAVHERVLRDHEIGVGGGALFRPTTHTQVTYFSARGPTADGRLDPDLSANGDASYLQVMAALDGENQPVLCRDTGAIPGTCAPRILFVSGTSLSAPTVAGAAALLAGEVPSASAVEIRNAMHFSANPAIFGDNSGPIDRGTGFLDVPAALALLESGTVSTRIPDLDSGRHRPGEDLADDLGKGGRSVTLNLRAAGFEPVRFVHDRFRTRVENLRPGQVVQFFVPSDAWTARLNVQVTNVTPELPPDQQNVFFGDDLLFLVNDAPTSDDVPRVAEFVSANTTAMIDHPQTGLVRVALQGDWTNAGRISATVTIARERHLNERPSAIGLVRQDDVLPFEVDVPGGAAEATFKVSWLQNWSRYPTNDIDLWLIDPLGNLIEAGASWNSPERVAIPNPTPGRWTAVIVGSTIFRPDGKPDDPDTRTGRVDVFSFQAKADGKTLKARHAWSSTASTSASRDWP